MAFSGAEGTKESFWIPVRDKERGRLFFRYNPVRQLIEIKCGGRVETISLPREVEAFFHQSALRSDV